MIKTIGATIFSIVVLVQSAHADVVVNFIESAPKDRFTIKNTGDCSFEKLVIEIDLSDSQGGLIFDTTAAGAGVEVFQPFEVREGEIQLLSDSGVKDGDRVLVIEVEKLLPDTSVSFTIDVDDTLQNSELGNIRVSGSEIMNGSVRIKSQKHPAASAVFGANSTAVVVSPAC